MAAKALGTWRAVDGYGPADFTQIDTEEVFPLGTRVKAKDVGATGYGYGEFVYVKGVANVVAKDACVLKGDYSLIRMTARSKGPVVIAQSALDAATKYGWAQIKGDKGVVNAGDVNAGAQLYATGAGGVGTVDDAAVAGDVIIGMLAATDDDTGTTVVIFPNGAFMGDVDNA